MFYELNRVQSAPNSFVVLSGGFCGSQTFVPFGLLNSKQLAILKFIYSHCDAAASRYSVHLDTSNNFIYRHFTSLYFTTINTRFGKCLPVYVQCGPRCGPSLNITYYIFIYECNAIYLDYICINSAI